MIKRKEVITEYARTGSIRATSRNLGLSRKTVQKYVSEHEAARHTSDAEYTAYLKSEPQYIRQSPRSCKVLTETVKAMIDNCLAENEEKNKRGDHKLCMKGTDIYQRLLNAGVRISYPTVTKYILSRRQLNPHELECYIRQVYSPGRDCEFDWGELHLTIDGRRMRLYIAVFTMAYSNYRMAFLFLRQDTMAFLESHRLCFDILNGAPHHMIYDNMRVAVAEFVGKDRIPTDALLRLERAYGFTHRFCNVRSGNEKGHVERSVEFVRRKAFSHRDAFESLEQANRYLYDVCMDLNMTASSAATADIIRRSREDLEALIPLRDSVSCFEPRTLTVDKYATIVLDGNHFSVPDNLVGRKVSLHEYTNHVEIYLGRDKVARHEKTPVDGWKLDLMHYINTFERKPGSIAGSAALHHALPELKEAYIRDFSDSPALFISLLKKTRGHGMTLEDFICAYDMLRGSDINPAAPGAMEQILFPEVPLTHTQPPLGVSADEIEKRALDTLSELTKLMDDRTRS